MRYTEKQIEIINEYEAQQNNFFQIEESKSRKWLTLAERNAIEHMLEQAAEDLEDARAEFFSILEAP